MNKKPKKVFVIGGAGKVHKAAIEMGLIDQKPVMLKQPRKTNEEIYQEAKLNALESLRSQLQDGIIHEYILIKRKESKISKAKRDKVVSLVEKCVQKGVLTKKELELIK